jgi:cell division protein FtsQ
VALTTPRPLGARPAGLDPQPFLRRQQREPIPRSRRQAIRRRLVAALALFGAGLAVGGVYLARHWLTHSPCFAVRQIAISATRHAPREELRHAVDRYRGRNLFRIDLARIERDLRASPWIASASVKRVLPDGLSCAVSERVPSGLALLRGRVVLIDAEGTPLETYGEKTREFSFPIFTGLDERNTARAARQAGRGTALLEFIDKTRPGLAAEISRIDLQRDDRIDLHMNDGGPIVRLNPRDVTTNLEHFLAMRDWLATNFGDGAYVDLRFRDRIALQPVAAKGD